MYAVAYKSTLNLYEDKKDAFENMLNSQMVIEKNAVAYEDMLNEDDEVPERDSIVVIKIADMIDFNDIPKKAIKLLKEHFEKVKVLEDQLEKDFSSICEKENVLQTQIHQLRLVKPDNEDKEDLPLAF